MGLNILGAGVVDDLTLAFRGDPKVELLFKADANPDLYTPDDIAGHSVRLLAFVKRRLLRLRRPMCPRPAQRKSRPARRR